jgi:hypothetical protein
VNVNIVIENNGQTKGTIGWLARNAAKIEICDMVSGNGRLARLMGADGKKITTLALADGDGLLGVCRASSDSEEDDYGDLVQVASEIKCWTDAAWKVIVQMIQVAKEHLEEPEEMAKLVTVKFEPAHDDQIVRSLAGIAHTDLSARNALVDRLLELE